MDSEIRSSVEEFNAFINSSVHQDFLAELNVRIEYLTGLVVDLDLAATGRDYDMFRGGIKNLREMREIFTQLRDNKSDDMSREEKV